MDRRAFMKLAGSGVAIVALEPGVLRAAEERPAGDWYERSFYLLHADHHTSPKPAVGSGADPAETARLIARSRPDVIQIHAKGNPGWTTYPSRIGHNPPRLARDVLAVWRDIARARGYAWSIYYNLGRDGEIMKRRPEWNRVGADGTPRDRMLCYHSGVAEEYVFPMIDEIMERYQPDALWFDGSCFTVQTCYCAKCRERFRRESGLEAPKNNKGAGWDAFKAMQRQIYRECLAALCACIHARDPRCRVAVNWAYGLHMPEEPIAGISHLTGDTGNNVDRLSVEAHWYDGQPRPFDLMTTVFVRDRRGVTRNKPTPQLGQEMAIIVANGGRYHAWDNPTPESALQADHQQHLAEVAAPFLRARQRWCLGSRRVPSVSLLYTSTHHYAASRNPAVCFLSAAVSSAALNGAADTLQRAHLDYELVSRERLLRGDIETKVLLAEDLAAVKEDEVAALRRFVEGGGTLLLTGGGALLPGLAELCGVRTEKTAEPISAWHVTIGGKALEIRMPLHRAALHAEAGAECVLTATAEGVDHPLLTRRRLGEGTVWAAMAAVFSRAQGNAEKDRNSDSLKTFLLDQIAPEAQRLVTTDLPATVETVLRRQGGALVLHLVNRHPGRREPGELPHHSWVIEEIPVVEAGHVALRASARPVKVMLQPQHVEIRDWSWADGWVRVRVPGFAVHQMLVAE